MHTYIEKRRFSPLTTLPLSLGSQPITPSLSIRTYHSIPLPTVNSIPVAHKWGRRAGIIKYTGNYVNIYSIMKITYVTIHSLYT